MDFEFSDAQEMLRDSVRRLLADRSPISSVRAQLDDQRGGSEAWDGLAELGVVGLLAPDEHGGAGMGMVETAVVLEELGRVLYPGPFASSAVGAVSVVALAGSDRDRAAILPGLSSGAQIGTVALAEPGSRSRRQAPQTAAEPLDARWTVTGTKVHVPDALAADTLFVTATDPHGELCVLAVEAGAPGLEVHQTPTVDGTRKEGTIVLAEVSGRRLGDGDATNAVGETMDRLAVAEVVDGVGAASRALEIAVEYAKDRRQFDRPIGSFQAVQHLCADMLQDVELARAAAYYACWAADAADAGERHRAATMAKAFASDGLYRVGASTIQVLGGVGFTWEHDAHLYYKRLLTLQQRGGGTVEQLEELASLVLD